MGNEHEASKMFPQLAPEAEVKILKHALSTSQRQYAHIYAFLVAVLRQMEGFEIRFKEEDFESYQMFKEAWEMRSEYDEESKEQILKLVYRGGGGVDGESGAGTGE